MKAGGALVRDPRAVGAVLLNAGELTSSGRTEAIWPGSEGTVTQAVTEYCRDAGAGVRVFSLGLVGYLVGLRSLLATIA